MVRFLSYYATMCTNKVVANVLYTKRADIIDDMVAFLTANIKKYFIPEVDFEIATPWYQRRAFLYFN